MIYAKRVIIATIFGFITGILCFLGSKYSAEMKIDTAMFFYILVSRGLIGFVIGISAWRLSWALHGIIIGLIVGLPFAISAFFNPVTGGVGNFFLLLAFGVLWGFIIELFTTVVFKAKQVEE